jgi:hypothetical protein
MFRIRVYIKGCSIGARRDGRHWTAAWCTISPPWPREHMLVPTRFLRKRGTFSASELVWGNFHKNNGNKGWFSERGVFLWKIPQKVKYHPCAIQKETTTLILYKRGVIWKSHVKERTGNFSFYKTRYRCDFFYIYAHSVCKVHIVGDKKPCEGENWEF